MAEYDLKNYADPGRCYPPEPRAKICIILQIIREPSLFLLISCTIDVISLFIILNVFQIWSTLAGYKELAGVADPQTETEKWFE